MTKRSSSQINNSMECLTSLGEIRYRALFGGYSLSVDDAVFAMVSEGSLYLRVCEQSASYITHPRKLLTFTKRGRPVSLNYYLVDEELLGNQPLLLRLSEWSLEKARRDKLKQRGTRRMKHLPNITWSLEMLLLEAGIPDEQMLRSLGATTVWYRLRRIRKNLNTSVLLALEGAIQGIHAAIIPQQRRQQLLAWAETMAQGKTITPQEELPAAEDGRSQAEG